MLDYRGINSDANNWTEITYTITSKIQNVYPPRAPPPGVRNLGVDTAMKSLLLF